MERIRRALVAAAALLAAACAGDPLAFTYPRSPHLELSAVPTEMRVNWDVRVPIVEVFIDGRGPWNFVLDSGAAGYAVDRRLADELKLERVDMPGNWNCFPVDTPGGEALVPQAARIHEFRAGPLVERDTGAMVFDLSPFERSTGTRIDGLLPAEAFRDGLLTIDFAGKAVTVTSGELPLADGKDVLSLFDSPVAWVEVQIEGRPCFVIVDSGSNGGFDWPAAFESSLRFRSPPVVTGVKDSIAGSVPNRKGRLDGTIAWGRHRFVDPVVSVVSGKYSAVGVELLREFRVTFDFSHSRVRLERAGSDAIRSPSVRSVGVVLSRDAGALTVQRVLEGSAAANAGVHVGDRVDTIDGRPAAEIGFLERQAMLDTEDAIRLRVVGADGTTREITLPVVTLVE